MASALSTFTDFIDTTGPSFLTSAEDVVNEACKNNYLLRRFLRGQGPSETVQGGSSIKDTIMFDEESTFQYYEPNQTFTWENPQVVENWEIQWRFCVDHMAYTDAEVELNVGTGMSRAARHTAYKRLKRIKEQRLWTSILNGMEDALFSIPSNSAMEATTGTKPYSIPAFLNEETNGLYSGFSRSRVLPRRPTPSGFRSRRPTARLMLTTLTTSSARWTSCSSMCSSPRRPATKSISMTRR